MSPSLPPYDLHEWRSWPFARRLAAVCASWALQGYGSPWPIYLVYALKVAGYVAAWAWFCSFNEPLTPATPGLFSSGMFTATAFQKAVIWSLLFEMLGLGCGSGPLTGRYLPPFGGALYFLRPGTTRLPLFPSLPLLRGGRRTWFDVLLYAANVILLLRALLLPQIGMQELLGALVLIPVLTLRDKTMFLVARGEHYFTMFVCFALAGSEVEWIAAGKFVWAGVWLWAAISKLNHHFPSVIAVMISNSPITRLFPWARRAMYHSYPDDLRPSRLARVMAHMGTVLELSFAPLLLWNPSPDATATALVAMLLFHIFITSHIPMGVPIEWNVMMVYGGFFLFDANQPVPAWDVSSAGIVAYLVLAMLVLPLCGNIWPRFVSFLCSMRYYAGNWAFSVWLFKNDSKRLDEGLVKSAPRVQDQLGRLYDETVVTATLSKVVAFRAMHLHGRSLQFLLPKTVGSFAELDGYEYLDGELVAGIVLGWNFGDGHLHDRQLLDSVQKQCGFAPGELRHIFVESQPFGRDRLDYTISDAATGVLETGMLRVTDLVPLQPWSKIA